MDQQSQLIAQLSQSREHFVAFVGRRMSDPEFAEDVLQGSLLKAIEGAQQLRDEDRLIPWFFRTLRNAIVGA